MEAAVKAGAGANLGNPTECYSAAVDTTVADTVKQDSTTQDTTTRDTVVQDSASHDTVASDTIPQDSVGRDSIPEDTSSNRIVLKVADVPVLGLYRVSLFDTKGALVRRVDVLPARIGDTAWITRRLYGVTQEIKGISRIASVQLADATKFAI